MSDAVDSDRLTLTDSQVANERGTHDELQDGLLVRQVRGPRRLRGGGGTFRGRLAPYLSPARGVEGDRERSPMNEATRQRRGQPSEDGVAQGQPLRPSD